MASRKKYDAVATVGEYQQNGETKKRYVKVGAVFEDDQGREALKLDAFPAGPDWTGWINFMDPKRFDNQPRQPATGYPANERQAEQQPASGTPAQTNVPDDFDDDIPF